MINIAIVEDEESYAGQIRDFLLRYSSETGDEFNVEIFRDGDEILEVYGNDFDIIFLDIEMPFVDGMTTAEEIRRTDPEVVIIFITNMAQYAIKGYSVNALDYVLKPVSYFAFSQKLSRAMTRMKNREKKYITVFVRGGTRKIDVSHIFYVESQDHNMVFHTKEDNYVAAGTMREAEESLLQYGFFRSNKGYLINLAHVEGTRDCCAVVKGELLPISRARKNSFMEALTKYMGEVVK